MTEGPTVYRTQAPIYREVISRAAEERHSSSHISGRRASSLRTALNVAGMYAVRPSSSVRIRRAPSCLTRCNSPSL